MKKLLMLIFASLVLVGCSSGSNEETQELRVFNWGAYIDESVIRQFEQENNARVIYELFESNEAMYTKLQDGSRYDVIIPSDYTTQRMREEGLLQEIDYSLIPNYENVLETLKGRHMDPENKYTVPYFWGNVGILYNQNTVDISDLESQGWNILMNQKYKGRLFFYDSERDAFMVALKALGYSMNTTNEAEVSEAYEWLVEMRQTMDPIYVTDEVLDNMISGAKDLAVVYSGDANYILSENPDMAYFVPEEGTNIWVDAMVIPANAPNAELAHKWINFMLSEDVALANTEEVGYTSPLQSVIDIVTEEGGAYEGIDSYVPRTDNPNDEEFYYDADMKVILANYWQRIKATQ